MSVRNTHTDRVSGEETVTGVDTDASGQVVIAVAELRHIESTADAHAEAAGGYLANVDGVSGNDVTVTLYQASGTDTELAAVTGSSGVTDVTVSAEGT